MRRIPPLVALLAVVALVPATDGAPAARARAADRPLNVIFLIADGCGPSSVALARAVEGRPLALDSILVGSIGTGSASSRVTDSAAAATALASGVKTGNRMIGRDPSGRDMATLLEKARARGMATGLVATSAITDATPAAFAAHVHNRASEDSVAVQQIEHGIDVMLGGGREWFLPLSAGGLRRDSLDLVARARERGWTYVSNRDELAAATKGPLLGLFASADMPHVLDRNAERDPTLPEMAAKALALLSQSRNGFFLMIEGSLVDHAGHANDPASHARELLEYDAAVREAIRFARRNGRTLVVSTSDHETGGLGLGRRIGDRSIYELAPEALTRVIASTRRMADSIMAGASADEVVQRYTAAPLTDDERAILAPAVTAKKGIGQALSDILSVRARVDWTTNGHTAVDVPLYAFGPGSERFRGSLENTDVAKRLAERMGVTLSASAPSSSAAR